MLTFINFVELFIKEIMKNNTERPNNTQIKNNTYQNIIISKSPLLSMREIYIFYYLSFAQESTSKTSL
jgi:hypothetical protein